MTMEQRRARAGSAPFPAARPIVRDFSGGSRAELTFEPRTIYDFLVSMNVAAGDDHDLLSEDAAWLKRSRAALPDPVRVDLDGCFGDSAHGVFHALPAIAIGRPEIADANQFVDALDGMTNVDLVRLMLADLLRNADADALTDRILAGEEDAFDEAKKRFEEFSKGDLVDFLRDPEPAVERMRNVVKAWLPVYQEIEPRVAKILERDVASRQADRDGMDQASVIERATGGIRWFPEPQVRRIVMAPSYFARPYNYIYQGTDWRLFAYPVSDAVLGAMDAHMPPQAVVRLYRALGDATRLRILKLLGERDWYLTELAQQLELSKPTMKHHLALLRAAGLVTVTEEGSLTYYSIRRERLDEAGADLHSFLS